MKQGEGREDARRMYVEQQMTFDEIALRLDRSDKTIRVWAEDGGWKAARDEYLKTRITTHEKLHTLIIRLADRMTKDCEGENEISPQSLLALNKLIISVKSLYQYETAAKQTSDADKPRDKEGLTQETLEKLEQQMGML
jgi:hypothetical protein